VFVASSSAPNGIRNQLIHQELAIARTPRRAQHTCTAPGLAARACIVVTGFFFLLGKASGMHPLHELPE
jgi:hypothetical protein